MSNFEDAMVAHTHRSIHPFTQIVYALLNSSATAVHIIVPLHHQPLSTSSSSYRRASCNIICLSIYIQMRSMEEACAEKMMELQMNDSTSYECKTTVSKLVVCDSVGRCSNAVILCVCVWSVHLRHCNCTTIRRHTSSFFGCHE